MKRKPVLPLLIVVFAIGITMGATFFSQVIVVEKEQPLQFHPPEDNSPSVILVPAVDENGNGVATEISVSITPGSGKTLFNLDIFSLVDTQNSILTAKKVAEEVTNIDISNYDLTYTIKANASVIEGPSAGLPLTIATIAAISGKQTNSNVMMTGAIFLDGRVGPVGDIEKKILVAKEYGATLFISPKTGGFPSQRHEYQSVVECNEVDGFTICETHYEKMESGEGPGIKIIQVRTIYEALPYAFLEEDE